MRRNLERAWATARSCPVTTVYVTVVVIITIVLQLLPPHTRDVFVRESSTNLVNLRRRPLQVLAVSAFIVPTLAGLWFMVVTAAVGVVVERWLGHLAVVITFVIGHFGATLFVAVMLLAGIYRHQIDPAVGRADDVGVSYGTVAVLGVATATLWGWKRVAAILVAYGYLLITLATDPGFTAVGHLTALTLGLLIAALIRAALKAARRLPSAEGPDRRKIERRLRDSNPGGTLWSQPH
jgi:hypothetical protein